MIPAQYQTVTAWAGSNDPCQDRMTVFGLQDDLVLAIADGAGGFSGGAQAAQMAMERVTFAAASLPNRQDDLALCRMLDVIGVSIQDDPIAGETTAVVVVVSAGLITGASAGDSHAWLIFDNVSYHLTEGQARKPLFGSGARSTPFSAELGEGTLLIATDGLWDYVNNETVLQIVRKNSLETAAELLMKIIRLPSGALCDDASVILCRQR